MVLGGRGGGTAMLVSASVWTLSSISINGNDLKHDIVEFNSNDALVNNLVPLIDWGSSGS